MRKVERDCISNEHKEPLTGIKPHSFVLIPLLVNCACGFLGSSVIFNIRFIVPGIYAALAMGVLFFCIFGSYGLSMYFGYWLMLNESENYDVSTMIAVSFVLKNQQRIRTQIKNIPNLMFPLF